MSAYTIAVYVMLFAGLAFMFRLDVLDMTLGAYGRAKKRRGARARPSTEIRREYIVGANLSFYEKKKLEIDTVLKQSRRMSDFNTFCRNVFLLAGAGFLAGALLQNPFLAAVLFFGLGSLPVMLLVLAKDRYTANVSEKLEVALNAVTSTYIQNEDISKAVKTVLDRIPHPIDESFKEFVAETTYINANIKRAIERLKQKIDNQYFKQWCDILIQSQDNSVIRFVLPSIISKMSDIKKMQTEFNTKIGDIYKEYSTMVFIELLFLPILYVLRREWFYLLFTATAGKAVLALNAAIVIAGFAYIIKINRPVSEI